MRIVHFLIGFFIYLTIFLLIDIYEDMEWRGVGYHVALEMVGALLSFVGSCFLVYRILREQQELQLTKQRLQQTQGHLSHLDAKYQALSKDFSNTIQAQFDAWKFSDSEKEVALLLIKGLSLEEIAAIRETKEKTVRQQASNLYAKSGLAGRHVLTAYFLEDLLTPRLEKS